MRSQTQFHTAVAVQRPRNLDKVVAAVLREAEFAGDAFYYSFPMGGKKIEGPTEWVFNAHFVAVPVEYYETSSEASRSPESFAKRKVKESLRNWRMTGPKI